MIGKVGSTIKDDELRKLINKRLSSNVNFEDEEIIILPRNNGKGNFKLSNSQLGIWLDEQIEFESSLYNISYGFRIKGKLNLELLEYSINEVIKRHETLRTVFQLINDEPRQCILPELTITLNHEDLTSVPKQYIEKEVLIKSRAEADKIFDLQNGPLIRVKLFEMNLNEYILIVTIHHIIFDGWSFGIFCRDFSEFYNSSLCDRESQLPRIIVQYADYSSWENDLLSDNQIDMQLDYWKNKLENTKFNIEFPSDYTRPAKRNNDGNIMYFNLDSELITTLKKIAKYNNTTLNTVLLTGLNCLLFKYTGHEKIVVGAPSANRNRTEADNLIGLFVNNLILSTNVSNEMSFKELLEYTKLTLLEAYDNRDVPIGKLLEVLQPERDLSRTPFFQVAYNYLPEGGQMLSLNDCEVIDYELGGRKADVDTTFYIKEGPEYYTGYIEYNTSLYNDKTIQQIIDRYIYVLKQFAYNSEVKMKDVSVLLDFEKDSIIYDFNNTDVDYPRNKTIIDLFEEQVEKTPNNVAVVYEEEQLTYEELNREVNKVAHHLRGLGVKPNDMVAMVTERSIEMIVGIYGILKAGGAYVPIDPSYPKERVDFILSDCDPKAILTYRTEITTTIPVLDLTDRKGLDTREHNPEKLNSSKDLAYVIYTSGTTGQPKGVMNKHIGVINLINWLQAEYPINENDVVMLKTTYVFDVSASEIFFWIGTGARLEILPPDAEKDPELLLKVIEEKRITFLNFVPSMLNMFLLSFSQKGKRYKSLKYVLAAGEALSPKLVKDFIQLTNKYNSNTKLINLYGPTEATIFSTYYECISDDDQSIPIGKPINNVKIYIMNENTLCGIGMPGELCIAGDGLARGYINRQELTEEKFINNPFGEGKLYRSGDLAKWLPDGNIEYLGRIDEQVKVRGYRIELGEVESVIRQQRGIKDVAVVAREQDEDKHLCAYLVAEGPVDIGELKQQIGKKLPEYMVPGYMMQIEELPITRNGKLDKGALPEIEMVFTKEYIGPRNEKETIITGVFEEILGLDKISVNESFFELGGHSLRAMRLVNRIESETGARIPLRHVFDNPTVEKLAKLAKEDEGIKKIPKVEEKEYYPMSSTQKRTYVIQEMDNNSIAYNMPYALKIKGQLDINRLKGAFEQMIERHEVLRTSLFMKDGEPVQKVNRDYKVDFEYVQDQISELDKLQKDFVRPFDLTRGNVIRMKVVDRKKELLLMLDTHHVVSDGMSAGTFLHELTALYNGDELSKPELQYKDYSEWIRTRDLSEQKVFWLEQFEEDVPVLDLPLDFTRPQTQSYQGAKVVKEVPANIVESIKTLSKETDTTEYMVLLSALMITLSKYARQEDIVIGSPISGRMHKDTENMMGMFINTLAMRGRPSGEKTYKEFLEELKEMALKAYEHQEYPFEELVEKLDIRRDMSRNPLFDVLFVLQNNEDIKVQLDGVESEYIEGNDTVAKFDLTFNVGEYDEKYIIELEYASALFKEETAQRIIKHYIEVIRNISKDIEKEIRDIEITTEEEKIQILGEFNNTDVDYPRNKTIIDLFEEQVEKTPNNVAVVYEEEQLTYEGLNREVNRVAHHLRGLGVKPNDMVAIVTERSIEMIVGIYGILKAGGAYVPIDPSYPKERVDFILSDCDPKAILTYRTEITTTIPVLDLTDRKGLDTREHNPEKLNSSKDLAYVIYTSGTTGQPKGVMVEHKSVVNFCGNNSDNVLSKAIINKCQNIYLNNKIIFDIVIQEIQLPLSHGLTVIVSSEESSDSFKVLKGVKDIGLILTPTKMKMYLESANFREVLSQTSLIMVGAEKFDITSYKELKKYTSAEVYNGYGPTETTCGVLYYEVKSEKYIPIGKPINNTQIYIMNENTLCGIGMPGELCIAGDSLSRGYINRPELTEEKFINNPFGEGKLYRSGDLAKWLPDGNIEYLGRIDEQVKVRGYRIELGEVESVIRQQRGIKDVAVVAREQDEDKHLCAYLVAEGPVDIGELKQQIGKKLPEYMVPGYMMQIEELPITRNGKLDKGALPEIEMVFTKEYIGPRNEKETIITGVFEEILGLDKISVNESFFELGGHSLRAMRLVNRIESETGARIPLRHVFDNPTVEKLAKLAKEDEGIKKIPKVEEKEYYPMSSTQKRTYVIQEMDNNSIAYNMPYALKIKGQLDINRLKGAFEQMIERHEVLRTSLFMKDGEPVQKVNRDYKVDFEYVQDQISELDKLQKDFVRPFDLTRGNVIRMKVVDRKKELLLMLDTHHVVSDGMSAGTFLHELTALYNGDELSKPELQYKDYSEWIRTRDLSEQKVFWLEQFEEDVPVLDLPLDFTRPQTQSYQGAKVVKEVPANIVESIKTLSKETDTTEYMVLLSALMITLSKYARQEDIVIGSPISGRMHKDTENMMGMFINTLAMRGRPSGEKTYKEFLEELKEMALKAYEHQEYPFEELVEKLDIRRDMSRNPLFDVLFVLQNNEDIKVQLDGVESEYIEGNDTVAKFDLTFNVGEYDEKYIIELEYASALFKEETAQRIIKHYIEVIRNISKDIEKEIRDIEITTEEEKIQILGEFNNTDVDYPRNKTIIDLFEEQVEKTPNNVAVVYEEEQLTYEGLNREVNRVAHHLRGLGVKPNDMVAIVTERSIEMIVGIYGILKAGGAYVPIDPSYPKERVDFILSDCDPKAILTYRTEITTTIPVLDLTDRKGLDTREHNPEKLNSSKDLAYVIYTSGTTGQPKGVMVEHKSVVNFCGNNSDNVLSKAIINKCQNIYLNNKIIFDIVIQEIQLPLSHGLTVIVSSEESSDSFKVLKGVKDIGLILTPTKMKMYLESANFREVLSQTSLIMVGAEKFDITSYKELKKYTSAEVYNGYGPTETTCGVLYYEVKSEKYIPIGKPINNTQIYIMNENTLCGIGMPGELCIAGDSLSRGYTNRPELTEEKFIDNPFGEGKLYRSGDLAKWLPDGNIEYLGRIDEQVKVRGYRIELGEVESVIRQQKGIKDVAVIAREKDEDKHLCAYLVAEGPVDIGELKQQIGKKLPEYMVPGYMMQIEELPITRNGKLDKGALPEIEMVFTKEYIGPRNEKETIITGVFEEILGLDKISVNESFFELGGHSLRAMRLVNRIESETGARIPLRHVFDNPTVEKLAKLAKEDEGIKKIPKVEEKEYYPMSSTQKRTYVIQEMDNNSIAYNMPYALKIKGQLDINRLKGAFEQMIERHEVLRTSLFMKDGEPVQKVNRDYKVDFEYVQDQISELDKLQKDFVRPFDLTRGNVIRMKVVDRKKELLLMLDTHHVVSDGMSAGTFLHELTALYNGDELSKPELQYKDYSEWIRTRDLSEQKVFWLEQFEEDVPVLDLPLDFTRPQTQSYQGAKVVKEVPANIVESIKTLSKETDTTEYMVLLSALMITLSKYARQEDIVIGSPISGRMHKDTENMMGMFINTLAMRGRPSGEKTYKEFLEELKEMALKAYEHQEYPFEELVEKLDIRRDMSRNPLFDVLFVLQNNEDIKVQLDGVESEYIEGNDTVAKFDLTFNVGEYDEKYIIELEYASALFKEETAQRIIKHYIEVIRNISKDIEKEIRDIEITTEEEKTQILGEFNNTDVDYPRNKTIIDLFEEQVEKTPNNVAVVYEEEQLTYEELNREVNRVAHHLRGLGVKPNDMVAMVTERSIEMIVGIYGILKAGGAYVPIDPSYPKERVDFILSDCDPKAILTYRTEITTTIPVLDLTDRKGLDAREHNPEKLNSSKDLAYVIYTSGTTGQPKGVMVEHRGVINLREYFVRTLKVIEDDNILQFANYTFDGSVWEMNMALLNGARLNIISQNIIINIDEFINYVNDNSISIAALPPVFYANIDSFKPKTLITAGSEASKEIILKAIEYGKYVNSYGPSECTIASTHWECSQECNIPTKVPIGKPINNTQIYIMNENTLCGIGMPGELCIAGDGLSRGYINRPELTEEKFIDNPFGEGKLYRSGDLAKWLPDGNIEYLGRIDEQVKVRGYRIELGEVESVIRQQRGIKDVAVVAREKDEDKHLCAYLVAEGSVNIGELKQQIGKKLPEYMVPGYMMQIEELPITRNGKLDKGALPEIEMVSTKEYIGPRNEKETIITGIFEEILGLDKISVNESFFELGGDSIKAIRIVSKIREKGLSVTVKAVMTEKTIENLSKICSETTDSKNKYTQGVITGDVELTPIMHIFAQQEGKKPEHFNQSVMIKTKEFSKKALKESLKKLVEHHDMLRAVYRNRKLYVRGIDEGELYSYSEYKVPYRTKEEIEEYIAQKGTEVQKSINLQDGPLMKTALFQTGSEEHLLIVIHHLAIDGVSWRILLEDLETGYKQSLKEKEITLPSKTASFQEWSGALKEYTKSEKFKNERVYWESIIADAEDGNVYGQLNGPRRIETIEVVSDRIVTEKLVYEAGKAYNTEINDLLLTALAKAINSVTGQTKISLKMEGHGREQLHKEISVDRTVGWFTSEYPIILRVSMNLQENIIKTKEMMRNIPNNGIGYGLTKYVGSWDVDEKGIDVCFNYLGNLSEGNNTTKRLITPSEYYGGTEVSEENNLPHPLTINGLISDGKLHFTVKYDAGKYRREFLELLMEEFKTSLILVVDHCVKDSINI